LPEFSKPYATGGGLHVAEVRPHSTPSNRLLAKLPPRECQRLMPHLRPVELGFKDVLFDPDEPIRHAYFPTAGVVSIVSVMQDGKVIEVGTIGDEGVVGGPVLLGADAAPYQCLVQVPGRALRGPVGVLRREADQDGPIRELLLQYQATFLTQVMQGVACNGLHPVGQRLCRWLLMAHDRVHADELPLTHDFLAQMLGVRRTSVGDVLASLQDQGLVRSGRSKVVVLDRAGLEAASCECYRVIREQYDRLLGPPAA
jgi:CRP-like cAMP-binding protein